MVTLVAFSLDRSLSCWRHKGKVATALLAATTATAAGMTADTNVDWVTLTFWRANSCCFHNGREDTTTAVTTGVGTAATAGATTVAGAPNREVGAVDGKN